jgi:SAM-dependent methyltransferase/uncharacterized membrane protein YbhN (UPF0104 family)
LVWVAKLLNWQDVFRLLRVSSSWGYFSAGVVFLFGSQVFASWRWWVLLRAKIPGFPFVETMRLTLVGSFLSNFLPSSTGGDVVRVIGISREGLSEALSSVLVDRLISVASMAALLPLAYPTFGSLVLGKLSWIAGSGMAVCRDFSETMRSSLVKLWRALRAWFRYPKRLVTAFVLAWGSFACGWGGVWMLARALDISISYVQIVAAGTLIFFLGLLPLSVNGIGIQEAGYVYLYSLLGVGSPKAAALALLVRAVYLLAVLPGGFWMMAEGKKEKEASDEPIRELKPDNIQVSQRTLALGKAYFEKTMSGVASLPATMLAKSYFNMERSAEIFRRIAHLVPAKNARMLEVGSGFGMLVAYMASNLDVDIYGVEPDPDALMISREVLTDLGVSPERVSQAVGEALPFATNSMDLVLSVTVLEHVQDPARVLSESVRVMKPGGHLYFTFPNYGSWWEGHYGVLWLPYAPKWLIKGYLRLLGRNPEFIDTLQLITYSALENILAGVADQVEILETGQSIWEQRLLTLNFAEWAQLSILKRWVVWIHRLKLVRPLIWIGKKLHWETPFTVILKKK